jgi:hypothetical protein
MLVKNSGFEFKKSPPDRKFSRNIAGYRRTMHSEAIAVALPLPGQQTPEFWRLEILRKAL